MQQRKGGKKRDSERRTTTGMISRSLVRKAVKSKLAVFQKRYQVLKNTTQRFADQGIMTRTERHDMNSYLTSIDGHMQLARMEVEEEHFNVGHVSKRLELVKRLSFLGVRLLKIAKNLPPKRWEAKALGERILEYPKIMRLTCELDDPKVKVIASNRAAKGVVKADDKWLSRLVLNLTANAMRAVSGGGMVYVTTAVKGDKFRVMVVDNGKGMTEEQKRKFEVGESFTTKTEDTQNHGLGSQVVKRTLTMHNASLNIKDNPPKGSIFLIEIPLVK